MDSYRASSAEKSASFRVTGIEGRRRSALLKRLAVDCRAFWNAYLSQAGRTVEIPSMGQHERWRVAGGRCDWHDTMHKQRDLHMLTECRCGKCNKLLARAGRYSEIQIKCPRCGTLNNMKTDESRAAPESGS